LALPSVSGGLALARAAESLLYGVSATDPVTFISVPLVLLAVACWRRQSRPPRRGGGSKPDLRRSSGPARARSLCF